MIAGAFGLMLGAGLLLTASCWLWPRSAEGGPRRDAVRGVRSLLAQAGLTGLSPGLVVGASAVFGLAVGAVAAALTPVVVLDVAAALAASTAPFALLALRARSRRRALQRVWPDALDHLIAGLRSGLPLASAVGALGESGPEPLRPAFVEFASDVEATARLGPALDDLKDRLADPVADRVVETLRLAREVGGGELPAVLRALAAHLRADAAIRSEVEARQTWVVGAARLGVAAPWLVLLLLAARPEAVDAYNSPTGGVVLLIGLVVSVAAYRLMLVLGRLPVERRWFG